MLSGIIFKNKDNDDHGFLIENEISDYINILINIYEINGINELETGTEITFHSKLEHVCTLQISEKWFFPIFNQNFKLYDNCEISYPNVTTVINLIEYAVRWGRKLEINQNKL